MRRCVLIDDNIGRTFGCYEILSIGESSILPSGQRKKNYICRCTRCGNIKSMNAYKVIHNNYKHCDKCDVIHDTVDNLIGRVFGMLTVVRRVENYIQPNGSSKVMYECKCSCGNISVVSASHLKSGHTRSCGCHRIKIMQDLLVRDLSGMRFGKLTVVEKTEIRNHRQHWLCACDCGMYREADSASLTSGKVRSCGCLVSFAEHELSVYLDQNNYDYEQQYAFDDCRDKRKLPFDFAVKDDNGDIIMLIELHGQQHYGPFTYNNEPRETKAQNYEDRKRKDLIKERYCKENGIPLLVIRYTDFHRKEQIFEDFYHLLMLERGSRDV